MFLPRLETHFLSGILEPQNRGHISGSIPVLQHNDRLHQKEIARDCFILTITLPVDYHLELVGWPAWKMKLIHLMILFVALLLQTKFFSLPGNLELFNDMRYQTLPSQTNTLFKQSHTSWPLIAIRRKTLTSFGYNMYDVAKMYNLSCFNIIHL